MKNDPHPAPVVPFPDFAALVDGSSGVPFQKRSWANLTEAERAALAALGFAAGSWSEFRAGFVSSLPGSFRETFAAQQAAGQSALRALGYSAAQWDAEVAARADVFRNPDILEAFEALLRDGVPITEEAAMARLVPQARDWGLETPDEKRALLYLIDIHGDRFTESARRAIRNDVIHHSLADSLAAGFSAVGWRTTITPEADESAGADTARVVNDASGASPVVVLEKRFPTDIAAVQEAVRDARRRGVGISVAGRRHSEGGHSSAPGSINLDMTRLNRVTVDARTGVATVQAGATWADVQAKIAPVGGAVKIMQTSNVFTVGGSVSVNCHGRTPGLPPVAHSVRSLTLVGPDGGIRRCSREEDRTLFRHVIGGYGLFGVLVEIELDTVPDSLCAMEVGLIGEVDLAAEFEASVRDPEIEMAYGRVSPALDGQVLFHRVRRVAPGDAPAGTEGNIEGGGMAPLVKLTMEASRRFPDFMETRWWIEKQMKGERSLANRNAFMSPNLDGLRQYWFNEGRSADILHEYFIPRGREARFLDELRRVQRTVQEQTLNITVRDVAADLETALPYARENVSSFVLYYNEQLGAEGEARQAWLQSELIEAAAACGGTFYLPYQLHYSLDQLRRIHPGFSAFAAEKRRRDPEGIFTNCWWAKYGALDLAQPAGPSSP